MNLYRTSLDTVRIQLNDYLALCYYKDGIVFSVQMGTNVKYVSPIKGVWDV